MPKYNVNNIPDGFKVHRNNKFALLSFIDQNPEELWTESRNIIREELKKTMPGVKTKEKLRWVAKETLKTVKDR